LSQGLLDRGVIDAIVEHKHKLLAEFMAVDRQHDWFLKPENWTACCHRVLPLIPWESYIGKTSIVPMKDGHVCYTLFLTRFQIQFRNKLGQHSGFRRKLTDQMFEGLLRADYSLRETLQAVDLNGDGCVSAEEFASALVRFGKFLTPEQAKTLYRTTIMPEGGSIRVEDFLAGLSVRFALSHPKLTTGETDFVPAQLDAICRDILDLSGVSSAKESIAVTLRRFFEEADNQRKDGYLEPEELIAALKPLRSCSSLSEEQLKAIVEYIDFNGDRRINYVELLNAFCVRHAEGGSQTGSEVGQGPKALVEDMLEAVHRVLHFEYAEPLRSLLRRLTPPGCTRCTLAKFEKGLSVLNASAGNGLLTTRQIQCLVETLDLDTQSGELEGHFDFEQYFGSLRIVDTMAGEDTDERADGGGGDDDDESLE